MDEEEIKRQVIFGTGYRKPPEHTQFRKGQSGNPKGRPKKKGTGMFLSDGPTLAAILDVAATSVPVRDGTVQSEMTMLDAVIRATFASAAKGNARSQVTAIALVQKAEEARLQEVRRDNEFWADCKRIRSDEIAAAKKRGDPEPKPLPHPDDVIIDEVNGTRFIGPLDEDGQRRLDETIRYRDILLMQDALDRRCASQDRSPATNKPSSAELLAFMLEQRLPERYRLGKPKG